MLGSLLRTVLVIVLVVAVVVGVGAFLLGYRAGGNGPAQPATVGTGGSGTVETARERGAEIGERVGLATERAGEALSDGALTAKIKSKMALDDSVKAREIHVSTKDKVVTLTGIVASSSESERAVRLARETAGVKSVTDQLRLVK